MTREQASRLAVVIPAYRPSAALEEVVRALAQRSFPTILVVDDGSGPEFAAIFARVAAVPGVQLLRHATNLGKGAALKTGINHAACTIPSLAGVVTAQVIAFAMLIGIMALPGAFLAKAFVERMPVHMHTAILDAVVLLGGFFLVYGALR